MIHVEDKLQKFSEGEEALACSVGEGFRSNKGDNVFGYCSYKTYSFKQTTIGGSILAIKEIRNVCSAIEFQPESTNDDLLKDGKLSDTSLFELEALLEAAQTQ